MSEPNAVACKQERTVGPIELFNQATNFGLQIGVCRWIAEFAWIESAQSERINGRSLHVDWYVDPNWTWSAMQSKIDRFFQVIANLVCVEDRNRVLGNRLHNRDDVDFLHAELAHAKWISLAVEHAVGAFDLARNHEHCGRIQPCACNSGNSIGSAGSGRDHADAEMVGNFGVGFGAHGAGLLV